MKVKAYAILDGKEIVRSLFTDRFEIYLLKSDAELFRSPGNKIVPVTISYSLSSKRKSL